jgi:hypothetical protein
MPDDSNSECRQCGVILPVHRRDFGFCTNKGCKVIRKLGPDLVEQMGWRQVAEFKMADRIPRLSQEPVPWEVEPGSYLGIVYRNAIRHEMEKAKTDVLTIAIVEKAKKEIKRVRRWQSYGLSVNLTSEERANINRRSKRWVVR